MIHHRQKMREKVVSLLAAADIKGIGERVSGTIFFPVRELPLATVWVEGESVRAEAGEYERLIQITVTLFMKATADVENDVDTACAQIEMVLDKQLGGLAQDGWLTEVRLERNGEGDQEYIRADLAYSFRYVTAYYNPTVSIH